MYEFDFEDAMVGMYLILVLLAYTLFIWMPLN